MDRSVLVVDDSATLRASVKFTLSEAGYAVEEAINGKDALQKLQQLKTRGVQISLIISDINMPEMDGITFVQEVKRDSVHRFIPVLILTTESQETKKMEGKNAGAAGWLVKPFNNDQLVGVVRKFVR
ncbi:MAG: two-component system response regulator [Candidatus Aquicultor primus]|uniref:Two-component system response regulator n=1 Tax=Candidatus Aquicultor primus TaxID=1797195 RepID=A0A1F2UGG3_9ACTN|nr:MAG: two-component system response regulator [Candidatus Aquicultor primus]HCG98549.1 two-component system response regulator [Actinomycetota bacterium]